MNQLTDDTFTVEMEYSTVVQGVPAGDHIPRAPEIGGMAGTPEQASSPTPPLFSSAPVSTDGISLVLLVFVVLCMVV
jgi:hypothetical protein